MVTKVTLFIIGCLVLTGCTSNPQVDQQLVQEYTQESAIAANIDQALQDIPDDQLYYHFGSEKIVLNRHQNGDQVYFIARSQGDNPLLITTDIYIQFKTGTSIPDIQQYLQAHGLEITEKMETVPDNYLVTVTSQAKYLNALQMANYIHEKGDKVVEYAMPTIVKMSAAS